MTEPSERSMERATGRSLAIADRLLAMQGGPDEHHLALALALDEAREEGRREAYDDAAAQLLADDADEAERRLAALRRRGRDFLEEFDV